MVSFIFTTNDLHSVRKYHPYGPPHRTLDDVVLVFDDRLALVEVVTTMPHHRLHEAGFLSHLVKIATARHHVA